MTTVCFNVLSPLYAVDAPSCAAYEPACAVVTTRGATTPDDDQLLSEPLSKPPFTTPPGGAADVTVNETVVVCVAEAPVPVTVIVYVPAAADDPTASVNVDDAPAVTDAGLNDAVVPAGTPDAENVTAWAEPLVTLVEIVDVALPPCWTLTLVGAADSEKSFVVVVPPQPLTLNAPIRVCQLNAPVDVRYSFVYQNVQSSLGSTARLE